MTKLVQFSIDETDAAIVEALKPIFKTRARSKVYRKAAALAYQNFKSAGQIKEATK